MYRSTHYFSDEVLLGIIRQCLNENPNRGYRYVTSYVRKYLRAPGVVVPNHKRIERLMQENSSTLRTNKGEDEVQQEFFNYEDIKDVVIPENMGTVLELLQEALVVARQAEDEKGEDWGVSVRFDRTPTDLIIAEDPSRFVVSTFCMGSLVASVTLSLELVLEAYDATERNPLVEAVDYVTNQ